MALITCPECQGKVSDKASGCIHCGYPFPTAVEQGSVPAASSAPVLSLLADNPYYASGAGYGPSLPLPTKRPKNGAAAALSFFVPGVGQIFKGQIVGGLFWGLAAVGLYMLGISYHFFFFIAGLAVHLWSIFDAASNSQ